MFILASNSPRRKELMHEICSSFLVIPSDINEDAYKDSNPIKSVHNIANAKGKEIHKHYPDDVVISADTIVVLDNEQIGKPKDEADAKRILRLLSNKTHKVITSFAVFYKDMIAQKEVISEVEINDLSETLINDYVASKSPLDKAGAYGVQDNDKFPIIKNVRGSLNNVIGFPTHEIIDVLKTMNLL